MVDTLFFWRLHDEVSVPNAAILMVGGEPSETMLECDAVARERLGVPRRDLVGFEAAFGALKLAVVRGEIRAKLVYSLEDASPHVSRIANFTVVTSRELWTLLKQADSDPCGIVPDRAAIQVSQEPDWEKTVVEVESVRRWLRSKGAADGFFVTALGENFEGHCEASFADPSHEHFAPELALAVLAWRALASEQKFVRGPKAAIEAWIDANPDAWLGEGRLSVSAKERITTLVNWKKTGGAPSSNG